LQQSASQQDIVVSLPDASFVFIGHESPLQQQQEAAADVDPDVPYENATMASPKTSAADITISIFFFMLVLRISRKIAGPERNSPANA
jgi:hypothetical protein